jgi:DNA-binding LacI/PurR family transcriptional regulator
MNKKTTIKDIARLAGVAPSTVSRVVTGRPGVGAEMRGRIWQLIREHNYRPNSVARSLVTQRLQTIGILVPQRGSAFFENPFFADVLMGASEVAAQENFDVLLYTGSREQTGAIFQERKVDGLLAVGLRDDDPLLPLLKEQDLKTVLVNREIEDPAFNWVSVDNRQGASLATTQLLKLGHRRIGFIGGPGEVEISRLRLQGYLDALREHGLEPCPELLETGNFDEESGFAVATKLLSLKPTAIFAANDLMAIGALKAAKKLGIQVPGELSLFGFDNIHSCLHTDPPLSTVKIPAFQMGQLACELMLEILAGEKPKKRQILLPTELVVRQSIAKIGG